MIQINVITDVQEFVNKLLADIKREYTTLEKVYVPDFLNQYMKLKSKFARFGVEPEKAKEQYINMFVPIEIKINNAKKLIENKRKSIEEKYNKYLKILKNEQKEIIFQVFNQKEEALEILENCLTELEVISSKIMSLKMEV